MNSPPTSATPETVAELNDSHAQAIEAGDTQTFGPFELTFAGGLHNAVHPEWPQNQNVGVMVNAKFYYPGDSLTLPDQKVELLAVPASGPWSKTGEAIDFIKEAAPTVFFRTHDGLANANGLATVDRWFAMASEKFGPKYHVLEPGQSLEF